MDKQEPNVKKSAAFVKKVTTHLDPEAIEQRRTELVGIDNRLAAREALAREERKRISEDIEKIKAEQIKCLAAINSGTVIEETKVREWMFLQTGNVETRRVDNEEKVDERPMTESERQTEMFALKSDKTDAVDDGPTTATLGELTEASAKKKSGKKRGRPRSQPEA